LGITEYTVQLHRGHIMRKMEADSFATLVRMADKIRHGMRTDRLLDLNRPRHMAENR
jgi:Bacterial regulatory proteins, luxR family